MRRVFNVGLSLLILSLFSFTVFTAAQNDPPEKVRMDAQKIVNEGVSAYKNRQYASAIENYKKAIALFESIDKSYQAGLDDVYVKLGFANYKAKQFDAAIEAFKKGTEFNPNAKDPYYGLGIVYRALSSRDKAAVTKGIAAFEKVIEIDPSAWKTHFFLAGLYEKNNEVGKAISSYSMVLQLSPGQPSAYKNRASLYKKNKEYNKAIDDYQQYLQIKPEEEEVKALVATLYEDLKQYQEAIKWYKEVLASDVNNSIKYSAAMKIADIYANILKKKKEAINSAKTALKYDSTSEDANYMIASLSMELEDYQTAYDYFKKLINSSRYGTNAKEQIDFMEKSKKIEK